MRLSVIVETDVETLYKGAGVGDYALDEVHFGCLLSLPLHRVLINECEYALLHQVLVQALEAYLQ